MKFLLVLALALVAVSAEEEKKELKFLPYGFHQPLVYHNNYAVPSVYNNFAYNYYPYHAYNPVQIKPVAKEFEVEVKKIEFVEPEGSCRNSQGALVPCRKARSADDEEMKPEEEKKVVPLTYGYPLAYNYPTFYNQYYNQYPLAYNYAHYAHPVVYHAAAGCRNNEGSLVPCRVARSADEEEMKPEEEKKVVPLTYGYPLAYNYPTFYNQYYNQYPLAYNYHHVAPVTYTAPKPIVHEVEYLKPVLKEVVQKVPLLPACRNAFGFAVPCADNE